MMRYESVGELQAGDVVRISGQDRKVESVVRVDAPEGRSGWWCELRVSEDPEPYLVGYVTTVPVVG